MIGSRRGLAVIGAWLGAAGCSSTDVPDVAGQWCFEQVESAAQCVGAGVAFMELQQSGDGVTGKLCDQSFSNCFPLQDGKVTEDAVKVTFVSGGSTIHLELDVVDADTLHGAVQSTLCGCTYTAPFKRIRP